MIDVGFIGLGAMGAPMARNVQKTGFALRILGGWAAEAEGALAAAGATVADSAAEMAGAADAIVLMLPTSAEVEATVLGAGGTLEGAGPGLTMIDMGTSDPASTARVAAALAEKGVRFFDSPVSRGVKAARDGTLTLIVGGEEEDVAHCRPLLEAMASEIIHVGPVGTGHLFKLLNQLVCLGNLAVLSEAFAFAESQGADLETLHRVMRNSSGGSFMLDSQAPDILSRTYATRFALKLAKKDIDLITGLADRLDVPVPIGAYARQLFKTAMRWNLGDRNESALYEVARAMAMGRGEAESTD